jgi:hypothetical protein
MSDISAALANAEEIETIPGDAEGIRSHAHKYSDMAILVTRAVQDLKIINADREQYIADSTDAMFDKSEDVVPQLEKIQGRYEVAGSELAAFAQVLADAQADARTAISTRDTNIDDVRRYQGQIAEAEDAPAPKLDDDGPTPQQQAGRLEAAAEPHVQALRDAHTLWREARQAVEDRARTAEDRLNEAMDADGLTDSTWDKFANWVSDNAGWIQALKDVLSLIATALAVLSLFFPGLLLLAAIFAGLTLLLSVTLASTGNGSWLDVALDTVALLTLGVGAAAGGLVKGVTSALRFTRSSRAAWTAAAKPGVFARLTRPVRAAFRYGDEAAKVSDDFARALPRGMPLTGRPAYLGTGNISRVWQAGGTDSAVFRAIANGTSHGAGGLVDDGLRGLGSFFSGSAAAMNWAGLGAFGIGWHDDVVNGKDWSVGDAELSLPGFRDLPGPVGDGLGSYGDWWKSVDGATVEGVGN